MSKRACARHRVDFATPFSERERVMDDGGTPPLTMASANGESLSIVGGGMFLLLCLVAAVIDPINVICFLSIKLMNYEYYHSINMSISFSPGQFHPNRSSFRSFRASSVSRCSRCW